MLAVLIYNENRRAENAITPRKVFFEKKFEKFFST